MHKVNLNIALISCRVDHIAARSETRDGVDQALVRWVSALGFHPLLCPNSLPKDTIEAMVLNIKPALVVLSGGNDLGQFPERDQTEHTLISLAEMQQIPLLGICRGMQLLAQHEGVELTAIAHHVASRHTLTGDWQAEVNSFHHYVLRELPPHYQLLAQTADGAIEAMRHQHRPWLAIMWHPEREQVFCPRELDWVRSKLTTE